MLAIPMSQSQLSQLHVGTQPHNENLILLELLILISDQTVDVFIYFLWSIWYLGLQGPFYYHLLTLILVWINYHMPSKM